MLFGEERAVSGGRSAAVRAPADDTGSLLLAPLAVTPTKALTPSHVKAFLWLDLLYRATSRLRPTALAGNRRTFDMTLQTTGFWAYLDQHHPGIMYSDKSERWIGERYLEFHRSPSVSPERVAHYRNRVEAEGFLHPASQRILEIWEGYHRALGLAGPPLRRSAPLDLTADSALQALEHLDYLLDLRPLGGGVYADLSQEGIPLRQLVDENGADNYMVCALRELLPLGGAFHQILLLCDDELLPDYLILERILRRAGANAARLSLGRVAVEGGGTQSRDGGWQEYTLDRLIERYHAPFGTAAFRLGMRLYFIAALGRSGHHPFSFPELERVMKRAAALLDRLRPADDPPALRRLLARHAGRAGHVDPYRIASLLFAKSPQPGVELLLGLFVGDP